MVGINRLVVATTNRCGEGIRGLPHYKQLNFGGGSGWLGAIAAGLMGTTQAGDKNNVALKSRVLPHDELPLVFPWKFRNLGSVLSSRERPCEPFHRRLLGFGSLWCSTAGSVIHDHWQSDEM